MIWFFGDFKNVTRRTASDKVLCDKAFNIAENPKYEYQVELASMVYNLLYKKSSGGAVRCANKCVIKSKNMSNRQLG